MSYSFNASGPTKTDAILDADAKFDKVVHDMPVHAKDKDLVLAHMRNVANAVSEPGDDEIVSISMSGYMSVSTPTAGAERVLTINSSCSVHIARKPV